MNTLTSSAECLFLVINLTGDSIRKQRETLKNWLRLKRRMQRKEVGKKAKI